jgi:hypothetical protein
MSFLLHDPIWRALDDNGSIMPGCKLQFYESGTTTPAAVYADGDLQSELTNPVESNAAGVFPAIYGDSSVVYRRQLYDADDVLISDVDPIHPHVAFPAGTIVMFDGTAEERDAAYPPSLWELCDGDNGTKDTRDRVPVGVSNTKPISGDGSTGGSGSGETDPAGGHDHGGETGGHSLTEAELATHSHVGLESVPMSSDDNSQSPYTRLEGSSEQSDGTANFTTIETGEAGDGDPHVHSITSESDHTHTFDATPPYFTVWFLKRKA